MSFGYRNNENNSRFGTSALYLGVKRIQIWSESRSLWMLQTMIILWKYSILVFTGKQCHCLLLHKCLDCWHSNVAILYDLNRFPNQICRFQTQLKAFAAANFVFFPWKKKETKGDWKNQRRSWVDADGIRQMEWKRIRVSWQISAHSHAILRWRFSPCETDASWLS